MISSTCSRRDVPAYASDAVPEDDAGGATPCPSESACLAPRSREAAGLAAASRGPAAGWLLDTDGKAGCGAAQWGLNAHALTGPADNSRSNS